MGKTQPTRHVAPHSSQLTALNNPPHPLPHLRRQQPTRRGSSPLEIPPEHSKRTTSRDSLPERGELGQQRAQRRARGGHHGPQLPGVVGPRGAASILPLAREPRGGHEGLEVGQRLARVEEALRVGYAVEDLCRALVRRGCCCLGAGLEAVVG